MQQTITTTNFNFPNQVSHYKGKVREVYSIDNQILVMIATDRLSAFDVVMPKGIPYKGQILNQIATKMMKATEDLVPNWLISTPDPNVAIGNLGPIPDVLIVPTGLQLNVATSTPSVISWNPIPPGVTQVWVPIDPDA